MKPLFPNGKIFDSIHFNSPYKRGKQKKWKRYISKRKQTTFKNITMKKILGILLIGYLFMQNRNGSGGTYTPTAPPPPPQQQPPAATPAAALVQAQNTLNSYPIYNKVFQKAFQILGDKNKALYVIYAMSTGDTQQIPSDIRQEIVNAAATISKSRGGGTK